MKNEIYNKINFDELEAKWTSHSLEFKIPGGTSRGVLKQKKTWFLKVWNKNNPAIFGIGECGMFKGLSSDDLPDYEEKLEFLSSRISRQSKNFRQEFIDYPSLVFGLEMALRDLMSNGQRKFYNNNFTENKDLIKINGLIWMGEIDFMIKQLEEKIKLGFDCIKLKIGSLDFDAEMKLLRSIRKRFSSDEMEIRVDANGAFKPSEALDKLKILADFELHSIEQPIKQGQIKEMVSLCSQTPLAIALDEELIGINKLEEKQWLLDNIPAQYIILKPTLLGGFESCEEWIELAEANGIGWWITSALESNIGLNAIAQLTYDLINSEKRVGAKMPQGLGTGQLFNNNIPSPLLLKGDQLIIDSNQSWDLSLLKF